MAVGLLAVGSFLLHGSLSAQATVVGGVVGITGQLIFGWVMFAPGIAAIRRLVHALWWAEGMKWLWVGGALTATFKWSGLPALDVLIGLIGAQVGFVMGLRWFRE